MMDDDELERRRREAERKRAERMQARRFRPERKGTGLDTPSTRLTQAQVEELIRVRVEEALEDERAPLSRARFQRSHVEGCAFGLSGNSSDWAPS
jgi:hypothetical protein